MHHLHHHYLLLRHHCCLLLEGVPVLLMKDAQGLLLAMEVTMLLAQRVAQAG